MSRYEEWKLVKENLNALEHEAPLVSEGDLWWASLGINVGSEIYGKDRLFARPVTIYKKLAHTFYFVIPATSRSKEGSWYVAFNHQGGRSVACLHQARAIDYRRLSSKIGTIDEADLQTVKKGFRDLYDI